MSLYLGNKPISSDGSSRLTGEIGDIGIAPFGIDESLNLRRYLNGQVISQTQFEAFTNKVKSAIALYPNLSATEENWQAEKALSKFGQVGKFVIDDENQTIRLPAVVNAQGLLDLTGIGNLVNESLPNITGTVGSLRGVASGAFTTVDVGAALISGGNAGRVFENTFDASNSSATYQTDAPVQQEAIQYPYYIQVATGIEETLPAIREYKVNNSDYFGKSIYSDVDPNNASLLASNGQYNARAVYPDYYDWLVEQMNKGVDRFKGTTAFQFKGNTPETESYTPSFATRNPVVGSVIYGNSPIQALGYATQVNDDGSVVVQDVVNNINTTLVFNQELPNIAWFTDYDFAINQNDQTFRLPLLNGSEDLPSDRYDDLTLASTTQRFTAPANGIYTVSGLGFTWVDIANETAGDFGSCSQPRTVDNYGRYAVKAKRGDQIAIFCGAVPSSYLCRFIHATGNGTLYYYVGDTVQDASLINAGSVLNQLSDKISRTAASDKELVVSWGMPDYTAGIEVSVTGTEQTFICPKDGFVRFMAGGFNGNYGYLKVNDEIITNQSSAGNGYVVSVSAFTFVQALSVCKFMTGYTSNYLGNSFVFYPLKGVN